MRTKVLCAAALAAGALTTMAQVYSANVVGYVNVTLTGGGAYNMICNPLDATMGGTVAGGNSITNLFASVAGDGDTIFRWNVASYDFDGTTPTYSASAHVWTDPFTLNPGEGIWYINNNNDTTVTFVGQVPQGSPAFTYAGGLGGTPGVLAGGGSYNAIGAVIPIGGSVTNAVMGIPAQDGDSVFPWNVNTYDFDGNTPTYSASAHVWTLSNVQIPPGVGFIYVNNGNDVTWNVNYTVQ